MTFSLASCLILVACWAGAEEIPDRPPPLTFDKPVDYVAWYNDFVRRGRDEKDNAYPLYLKLCPDENGEGGFPRPEGKAAEQFEQAVGRVWTAEEFPELATYLKECESYFATLEELADKKYFWIAAKPENEYLWEIKLSVLSVLVKATKAMVRRSWLEQPFQQETMIETWRMLLVHAQHLEQACYFISSLTACAIRITVFDQVLAALDTGTLRPSVAETVRRMILKEASKAVSLADGARAEMATYLAMLQEVCGGPTRNDELWMSIQHMIKEVAAGVPEPSIEPFHRERTTVHLWTYYDDAIDILEQSTNLKTRNDLIALERDRARECHKNQFLRMTRPDIAHLYRIILIDEAHRRAMILLLHIYAEHARTGGWPASLDEVRESFTSAAMRRTTVDPFSRRLFVYRVEDGQPLLYSVGFNGKDDGGVHHPKFGEGADGPADYVFWPRPKDEKQ